MQQKTLEQEQAQKQVYEWKKEALEWDLKETKKKDLWPTKKC